jgi:Na+/H+ antiporter NhaD/arsenite permease-like protein
MLDHSLSFSLPWAIPFAGFLLSLAVIPTIASKFWHKHYKLIVLGWISSFLGPLVLIDGFIPTIHLFVHALFHHYIPFMALITVLFVIGGGIHIAMKGKASSYMNAGLITIGCFLANIIGTMGASMLLIRPIISLNRFRQNMTHVIIFFIFLVSNIGGILTPLGDPPLFIGFLNNVDFFWTTKNLFLPFLFVGGLVLFAFWIIDQYYFYHDPSIPDPSHMHGEAKLQLRGQKNFLFLGAAIIVIILESLVIQKPHISILNISINISSWMRDFILFVIAYSSWKVTPQGVYEANHFTWEPLEEVALIFLGIFITILPVLSMLKAGNIELLNSSHQLINSYNISEAYIYFWLTGILSALLDNAPTYLLFFNLAGGEASTLMTTNASILTAISTGAVFLGAMTYIGNAPNFIVRAIATRSHIKMPGFLGYLAWSLGILLPIFLLFSRLWFL